jgi:hypothetical protein
MGNAMSFSQDELDSEEWLPIVGREGYEVSSLGRVRSWRVANGRRGTRKSPLIRKLHSGTGGYMKVSFGGRTTHAVVSVHKLVLTAFVGPRPVGMFACHFPDPSTSNNRLANLRWATPKENCSDRDIHGNTARGDRSGPRLHPETRTRGERVNTSKLTESSVRLMRFLHVVHGASPYTMARWFGVSQPASVAICSGRHWKHVPMQQHSLELTP